MQEVIHRLGELPEGYEDLINETRGSGRKSKKALEMLKGWVGENPLRQIQVEVDLNPPIMTQPDGRKTNPVTLTSFGTGLSGQEKTPRDLRTEI